MCVVRMCGVHVLCVVCVVLRTNILVWLSFFPPRYDFRRPAPGSDAVGGAPTHTAADVHAELVPPLLQSLWHGNGNFATVIVHGRVDGAPSFGGSPPAGSASGACTALCAEVLRAVFEVDALDEAEGDDDDDGKEGKEGKEGKGGKEGKEEGDAVAVASPSMQLRTRAAEHELEGAVKEGEGGDTAASSAAPLPALEEVTVEMSAMDLAHGEVWDVSVYCIDPRTASQISQCLVPVDRARLLPSRSPYGSHPPPLAPLIRWPIL